MYVALSLLTEKWPWYPEKTLFFGEILWKHIHIFYIYTTHKRPQKWWRYHHYLNVEVSWNVTFQFCFFFCSESGAVKKIVLIIVYGKAFFHPYFYYRYKSLVYLVTLKLWYSYSYWLHILLLFAWILFFDTCLCVVCCLVLDLACRTSTLNITLTFSVAGRILGILYFWGLLFNFSLKLVFTREVLTGFGISLVQLGN